MASLSAQERTHRHRRIEAMGITLTKADDPVDGHEIVVIDESQFGALLEWIDAQIGEAIQARPIEVRVTDVDVAEGREPTGRAWTLDDVLAHWVYGTSTEPTVCKCGEPPHGESAERPATTWAY